MKLNLGAGPKKYHLEGWKNLDKDPACRPDEAYDVIGGIQEANDSVEEILISHLLMYFRHSKVLEILKDCHRVLKPGGILRVTEDNRHLKIRDEKQQKQYGDGELFDKLEMSELLRQVGFSEISEEKPFPETRHHLNLSEDYPLVGGRPAVYFLRAVKPEKDYFPIVYLALDDFSEKNTNMDLLWRLRKYFDNFKINLFAVPDECLREKWLEYISSLGWINLCMHGYNHTHFEELDETTLNLVAQKYFRRVYKAPFWELSDSMYNRLRKLDFKILLYPNDEREGIKFNWEIKSASPISDEIHGYGHIYPHDYLSPTGKGGSSLIRYWENITILPKNATFKFY